MSEFEGLEHEEPGARDPVDVMGNREVEEPPSEERDELAERLQENQEPEQNEP